MNGFHRPALAVGLTASVLCLTACAGRLPLADANRPPAGPKAVELTDTPFFPQEDYQCGPAALATVLSQTGVTVTPEELTPRVYLPGKQGSLQLELVGATRRYDRIPYELRYGFTGLLAELRAGRPVLVLQNLGVGLIPVWHYAVVVGYDEDQQLVILRSGETKRRETPLSTFINTWSRADFWGLTVLEPGELPLLPDHDAYLKAVASFEEVGKPQAAVSAYAAAVERWPDSFIAMLGLGNAHYASRNLPDAEAGYRRALVLAPRHPVALNNLAQVLAEQGCYSTALENIDQALSIEPEQDDWGAMLAATRREILSGLPEPAADEVSCSGHR